MPLLTYRPEIAFNRTAIDVVTGFTGRITAILRNIAGHDQVLLEGSLPTPAGQSPAREEERWFAVGRVALKSETQPDRATTQIPGPVPDYVRQDTYGPAGPYQPPPIRA